MRNKIIRAILLCLEAAQGVAMPESSLVRAVRNFLPVEEPTTGDVLAALKDVSDRQLAEGVSDEDELAERTWTLTVQGTHKARQLR